MKTLPAAALILSLLPAFTVAHAGLRASPARVVAQETGSPSLNDTRTNGNVTGTDLGIMWDDGAGNVLLAFGDTFGGAPASCGPGSEDWRNNVFARSQDTTPGDGIQFSLFMDAPFHAGQGLPRDTSIPEYTVIPTAGISVGATQYLHYMSIQAWGTPAGWTTNHSGLACSFDGGRSWTRAPVQWSSTSNFSHIAMVRRTGYVYLFGAPAGRFGGVKLARVRESALTDASSYQYWTGHTWQASEAAATYIVPPQVGELSVQYNATFGRWLMTYLDESRQAIVLRDSVSLTGPWTGEKLVARASDYPGLYGAYLHPWFSGGTELFFNMSQWCPYNVFLMRSTLSVDDTGDNLLSDPGFEDQLTHTVAAPWSVEGDPARAGVDRGLSLAYQGSNNVWLRAADRNWHALRQQLAVVPYSRYRLTAYVRSANVSAGYLGARTLGGTVLGERSFGTLAEYTRLVVEFNPGAESRVDVYAGFWAPGSDAWVQLDELSVTALQRVQDYGFESQTSGTLTWPWGVEGPSPKGVDLNAGLALGGFNNAWIRTSALTEWNAVTQEVPVEPFTSYRLSGWLRSSGNFATGYFGVRAPGGGVIAEQSYGRLDAYTQLTGDFNSGPNSTVKLFVGYWSPGGDSWVQIDNLSIQ